MQYQIIKGEEVEKGDILYNPNGWFDRPDDKVVHVTRRTKNTISIAHKISGRNIWWSQGIKVAGRNFCKLI